MAKKTVPNFKAGEVVISALKKLMKNTGWTTRSIIKFIKMEYKICDPTLSRKVSRALKRGVKLGLLQVEGGRYKLNDISDLARCMSTLDLDKRPRPKLNKLPERMYRYSSTNIMASDHYCCYRPRCHYASKHFRRSY